ncbi:MAG TPA: Tn3 family transposase [Stellaceae bacterium]|nr:Tn3 family transposase [Stellaceae bacterium]
MELSSNRHEDHELSMLCLHLLQNCMVFVNTLLLQLAASAIAAAFLTSPGSLRSTAPDSP